MRSYHLCSRSMGVLASLRLVRESPALSSWFDPSQRPIGGEMAERSEVIRARTEAYLRALGVEDVEQRARWLVRVMVSLLVFPGHDEADERAMLEEFVLPTLMPVGQPLQQASGLFDHHSVESKLQQFIHRKLSPAIFECNDDTVDPWLRPPESLQGRIECLFALVLIGQHSIPTYDVHACIFACP